MNKFNSIIFDFNGLIVDDESIHCELFQKVLMDEEIELSEKDYWEKYLGFDDKGLIETVFKVFDKKLTPKKSKDLIRKKNELYFPALKQKLRLFDGVSDFIKKIQKNYPLAIVSGALKSEIEFVLEESKLARYFPIIIAADDTKHGKPNPEGFVLALAQLKKNHPEITAQTCLVLEDSIAGIQASKKAGMKVVAMTHTYPKNQLNDADFVVDEFDEIERILNLA